MPDQATVPAGTDLAFDMGISLVERQFDRMDRLDAKTGTLSALLGAVIVWSLGAVASGQLSFLKGRMMGAFWIGLLLLGCGFVSAVLAVLPRQIKFPVNYEEVVNRRDEAPGMIKYQFLEGILRAYKANRDVVESKGSWLTIAVCFSAAGVLVVAGGLAAARILSS